MAWDLLGKNAELGVEEYSGDTPMDAFGGALARIADACEEKLGRLPRTAELVAAFEAAVAAAPKGAVLDSGTARGAAPAGSSLATLRTAAAREAPSPKRQRAKTGDVLAIPYAGDRAVYGWVLFVPKKHVPSPGLGVCLVVLDRDVRPGDDLEEVVRSKIMLGPLHPNDREIREGLWRIVGNVQGDFDALLPRFAVTERRGTAWVSVILDYAKNEVPDTPENRERVREPSVGGARWVMSAARAIRGDARWLGGYDEMLPHGERRP